MGRGRRRLAGRPRAKPVLAARARLARRGRVPATRPARRRALPDEGAGSRPHLCPRPLQSLRDPRLRARRAGGGRALRPPLPRFRRTGQHPLAGRPRVDRRPTRGPRPPDRAGPPRRNIRRNIRRAARRDRRSPDRSAAPARPTEPARPAGTSAGTSAAPPAVTAVPRIAPPPPAPATVATSAPPSPARLLEDARRQAAAEKPQAALALCLQAAELAQRSGDAAAREKALRAGVELAPDRADAHLALGRLLLEKKDAESAVRALQQAVALASNNADAHLALAGALIADDDHDAAVLSLRKVLQIRREDPEARWTLAALYDTALGLKADAAREYREFVNLFPQDPRAVKAGERLRALQPAATVTAAPPPAAAVAAAPPPQPAPAPAVTSAPPAAPATAAPSGPPPVLPVSAGRRIEFRVSAQRDIQGATTAFNRGYGYHRRGDLDRAIYDYLRAVEMDSRYVLAFYNLGDVYRQRGDLDLARDAYSRALEISPEDGAIRYNLALVLDLLGETLPAQQQLRFILARQPDHAAAHYMLGLIYTRDIRSAPVAKAHLQKFVELQPSDPKAAGVRQWLAEHP
ncbi:MAG: tetratricopeptide repeat protein [Lentisphaerae bacterium]|nr:tetratricopeptide repeat protein [Lentisphaerota bacterium]